MVIAGLRVGDQNHFVLSQIKYIIWVSEYIVIFLRLTESRRG